MDGMTTPLLTSEQVAEVMLLAQQYAQAFEGPSKGLRFYDRLESHLFSLTAPASVQPVVKEALTTPFDPEAMIDIRGSRDEP